MHAYTGSSQNGSVHLMVLPSKGGAADRSSTVEAILYAMLDLIQMRMFVFLTFGDHRISRSKTGRLRARSSIFADFPHFFAGHGAWGVRSYHLYKYWK